MWATRRNNSVTGVDVADFAEVADASNVNWQTVILPAMHTLYPGVQGGHRHWDEYLPGQR